MTSFLILDSRDRIRGTSNDCDFNFKYGGIVGTKSVELLNFSMPMTFYNVNSTNNVIYFNDSSDRVVAIPAGNYDMNRFLAIIKLVMESVSTVTFTVTYDETTMKILVNGDSPFSFTF